MKFDHGNGLRCDAERVLLSQAISLTIDRRFTELVLNNPILAWF